jgi:hypothetical protein
LCSRAYSTTEVVRVGQQLAVWGQAQVRSGDLGCCWLLCNRAYSTTEVVRMGQLHAVCVGPGQL